MSISFPSSPSSVAHYHVSLLCNLMENITDNVAVSVDQFYTIRAVLMSSMEEEEKEEKEEQK